MSTTIITKENFQEKVLHSHQTVLIDFWADWCGPCRMLSPIIDQVAADHSDIKIGKVNVDEQPELAARFGVMSIPTLIVFRNGEKAGESVGLIPKEQVEALLR